MLYTVALPDVNAKHAYAVDFPDCKCKVYFIRFVDLQVYASYV